MKKYPKSAMDESKNNMKGPAYVTWGNTKASRESAFAVCSDAIQSLGVVGNTKNMAVASRVHRDYSDLSPGVSGRPGLTRQDYEYFRPNERVATSIKGVISQANKAYKKVGIINSAINLMSDFTCQGIRLSHRNKNIERFYRKWFDKISGKDRSERFVNNLYKSGGVIIRRRLAKLSRDQVDNFMKTVGFSDIDEITNIKTEENEIPLGYRFVNPLTVEPVGGDLSVFLDEPQWKIKIPAGLQTKIKENKRKSVVKLPSVVTEAGKSGFILLPPDKTITYFYKKDDWDTWGQVMLEAILDDIILLEKLRLADLAALDGAMSAIRIFKLGSLEHKIMPTRAAVSKLNEILESHTGTGSLDLIWSADIELIESNTNVHEFLGEEKYRPTLQAIHAGLGIPSSLTGSGGDGKGLTNNFISLKTLVERLNYGRDLLTDFWNTEIKLVQRSMGFRFPATVEFDFQTLANEDAEKALLIQLSDRNLISDETLHTKFGIKDTELEKVRLKRENKCREKGQSVPKAGPWHDPEFLEGLKKIALQNRIVTPSQVGLVLEERVDEEEVIMPEFNPEPPPESNSEPSSIVPNNNKKGEPQKGRPKNSKDKIKRKQKQVNPQTKALLELWATSAQYEIDNIIKPIFLKKFNKKDLRGLTLSELEVFERIKFGVLCNTEPFSDISTLQIKGLLDKVGSDRQIFINKTYKNLCSQIRSELKRKLTLDECHKIQSIIYIDLIDQNYTEDLKQQQA